MKRGGFVGLGAQLNEARHQRNSSRMRRSLLRAGSKQNRVKGLMM
jgi:hypothetical protein